MRYQQQRSQRAGPGCGSLNPLLLLTDFLKARNCHTFLCVDDTLQYFVELDIKNLVVSQRNSMCLTRPQSATADEVFLVQMTRVSVRRHANASCVDSLTVVELRSSEPRKSVVSWGFQLLRQCENHVEKYGGHKCGWIQDWGCGVCWWGGGRS